MNGAILSYLAIVMVAFSEDNRALVLLPSIVCREAAFDFKSGTIGKLSVMTIPNLVGGLVRENFKRGVNKRGWVSQCAVPQSRSKYCIHFTNTAKMKNSYFVWRFKYFCIYFLWTALVNFLLGITQRKLSNTSLCVHVANESLPRCRFFLNSSLTKILFRRTFFVTNVGYNLYIKLFVVVAIVVVLLL